MTMIMMSIRLYNHIKFNYTVRVHGLPINYHPEKRFRTRAEAVLNKERCTRKRKVQFPRRTNAAEIVLLEIIVIYCSLVAIYLSIYYSYSQLNNFPNDCSNWQVLNNANASINISVQVVNRVNAKQFLKMIVFVILPLESQ